MRSRHSGDRWLYAWSAGYATIGAASLLVPLYALALGAGPFFVGVLASTAAFAGVPAAVVGARVAHDASSARALVAGSLAATAVALAVVPAVSSLLVLAAVNVVLWLGVGAAAPVLTLLVVTGAAESAWDARIARLNALQGYGWLAGLLAGTAWPAIVSALALPVDAQRSFFLLAAAVTAGSAALAARWLPGSDPATARRFERSPRTLARLVRGAGSRAGFPSFSTARLYWGLRAVHPRQFHARLSRPLAAYLAGITCCFTGFAAFFGPLPAFFAASGFSTDQVFAVFLANSAASAVFFVRAGRLSAAHGAWRTQAAALATRALAFPAVALVGVVAGFGLALPLLAVVGVTWAVVAVTAATIVTRLAPAAVRANALGAYASLGGVGSGVGSALGGLLAASFGYPVAFVAASALVVAGGALAAVALRHSPYATSQRTPASVD